MGEEKAIYAAVATFAVWTLQKVIESVVQLRRMMRARLLDTSQLLNDIHTNLDTTKNFVTTLEAELAGEPCPLQDKLDADPEYYIFSASAESTIEVFRSDAVQRYSHLDSDLFDDIKLFYDLQKVIAATFVAAMTDNFKLLIPSRKIGAMRQLHHYLQQSVAVGERCLVPLKEETEAIYMSRLWKILFLSHRKSKRPKEQSVGEAT